VWQDSSALFGFAAPPTGLSNTEPRLYRAAGVRFSSAGAQYYNIPFAASTAFGDDVVFGSCSVFYVLK
jgi:hypothetical protein